MNSFPRHNEYSSYKNLKWMQRFKLCNIIIALRPNIVIWEVLTLDRPNDRI